jgi:two-component system cell cycle sensor histidine kinase PleC
MTEHVHASISQQVGQFLLPALDCLRAGISIFDADDMLVYCNEHFRYIFRSFETVDELIGLSFVELLRLQLRNGEIAGARALDDPQGWIRDRLARRRNTYAGQLEQQLTDGRWMSIKERPLPQGGYIGLWQDVTALKLAHLAIADAVDSTSDGFALWDQADRLVTTNPMFAELHGYEGAPPAAGERFAEVLDAALRDGLFDVGEDAEGWRMQRQNRGWSARNEVVVRHRSGRWLLIKDRRIRDGGTATVMTDITDHKENELQLIRRGKTLERAVQELEMVQIKLEENGQQLAEMAEELQIAKVMAEQSSAAKSAFLSNMSHELRTPLNAIIGFAEVIRDGVLGPRNAAKYQEYAADIHSAGTHLLALINDILDLAKIEAGRMELFPEELPAHEVVTATMRLMEPRAAEKQVGMTVEIDPGCGPLVADERALRQALLNLLSNAVKFTSAGGRVGVRVVAGPDGGVDIIVWDTGIGIAREDLPRVLQRFEQVRDPLVSANGGTGLGLAIVQSLMDLHGGRFYLQSERGQGTTATLSFQRPAPDASVH